MSRNASNPPLVQYSMMSLSGTSIVSSTSARVRSEVMRLHGLAPVLLGAGDRPLDEVAHVVVHGVSEVRRHAEVLSAEGLHDLLDASLHHDAVVAAGALGGVVHG